MLSKEERKKINRRNRNRSYSSEKAAELLFRAKRISILGGEDLEHLLFSVEVKSRQLPPKWLEDWMTQAEDNCPENRVPLVYMHEISKRRDEDLVFMRVKDFRKVFQRLLELGDPRKTI